MDAPPRARSTTRLLLTYGVLIMIPVVLLGVGLSLGIRSNAADRGISEARSEALIIAQTAVEPELEGRPLSEGLSPRELAAMQRLTSRVIADGQVLRLRLRDQEGNVVFADDQSGDETEPAPEDDEEDDDEVVSAAAGRIVALLTHVNADSNDTGPIGPQAVEVYLPLVAGMPEQQIGVLEIYVPYAPIKADVDASLHVVYRDLGYGLAGLFVVLVIITLSASRGLRRELATNAWMARHDALTDLPNRELFLEQVRDAAAWAGKTGRSAVVAIMDLDHFKDLNDALGHPSGDELLIKLARRLDDRLQAPTTVARLGGDEFGVVLRDPADARAELAGIADLVAEEVEVGGLPLSVAPSIGYVTVTDAETTSDTIMQRAEVAMYAAKADHAVVLEYSADLEHFRAADLALIAAMPQGLKSGQFLLHYQPQADTRTGAIVSAEALVRWQHPTQGLLPPGRFLPMAEQTDLIEQLTTWVLATALADAGRLAAQGTPIPIAVNVSARSVVRTDFAQQVIDALDAAGVPPSQLVVEVTETALLTNPERARAVLAQLDGAGVRVSIDDFGQGQTSLGYLADFPIHELKVDRAFVTGMSDDAARTAIVQAVIELGHHLDMRVVAEGVETEIDLAAIRDLACDVAQGYHVARPMEFAALVALLQG